MSGPGSPSLGHLLIQRGLATEEDIKRCVAVQRERARRGDFARLGAILVEQGIVTSAQVEATLREQQIVILKCSVCPAQYNIENYDERGNYECRKCGGLLRRPENLQSLVIQDTMRSGAPPSPPPRPPLGPRPATPSSGPHSPAPFSRPGGLGLPSPKTEGTPPAPPQGRTAGPQDTIRAAPSNLRRRTNVAESPADTNIIGDYEILGEIARGGMGVIYKARQLGLERVVALKTLNSDEARHDDAVERFQREARSIASLRHPNLVTIHTVDHRNGVHFFTMDFVEGIPLDALLKRDGPMEPKKAITLLLPIIDALKYAHSKGVMHRDLKPANIIIDRSGVPFLVDFGIAKRKGERQLTEAGEILGSIPYMAPEYIVGEEFTEGCDVYSFGVVMYEALAGFENLPFGTDQDGVETIRLLKRIAYEAPAPIRDFRPDLDPRVEGIITRAISRDIKVRYTKAAEIAKDLQSWLNEQSSSERPAAQLPRPAPSAPSRSSGFWPPLALIAASIAAGATGLFLAERGKAAQREREVLLRLLEQARQLESSRPEAAAAIRAVVQQQVRDRPELADLVENP